MSSTRSKVIVAASVGVVEALKEQGNMCRWNSALRSMHQQAKNQIRLFSQANRKLSSPTSSALSRSVRDDKVKKSEDSLRTAMHLCCWGPN
ncbi:hypothetical protein C1H46_036035 [Malus baccata]|uniref:Wound-responsive family protein n=1 Tax=Malus baccata TaxID=106549 RepID=A0A540KW24_MALBA|nr:hypothetical protein C1H46_036035 [Malus baccata]